jgi:hypothetical protein
MYMQSSTLHTHDVLLALGSRYILRPLGAISQIMLASVPMVMECVCTAFKYNERWQCCCNQSTTPNEYRQCTVADSANVQHPVMIHCALPLTSPHTNGCASARSALPESTGAHLVGV